MIEISLTDLAVVVLGISMIMVIFFAWLSRWTEAKNEKRALRDRVICRLCLAVFDAAGRETEQSCPECGAKTGRQGPTPLG